MTDPTPSVLYPSLTYDDPGAAIDWLCRAFGFVQRLVVPGPDGGVVHSELSFGDAVIMVGGAKPDQGRLSPRSLEALHQTLCLRVADPDQHFAQAKAAGAEVVQEIADEEYGSRGFMVKDPEGHLWYLGSYQPGAYWDQDQTSS